VVESDAKYSVTCAWTFGSDNKKDIIKSIIQTVVNQCCEVNCISISDFTATAMVDKCEKQIDALLELKVT
jgi:hypothetical protein